MSHCRQGARMKALSLWQPWASLWVSARKIHETRSWPTLYRGPLLVHAAKRFEREVDEDLAEILDDEFGPHWGLELPTGALLGIVTVEDCWRTEDVYPLGMPRGDDFICGNFGPGRYAFRRADEYRVFDRPIPFPGRQGLFNVPDSVLAEVVA